MINTLRIEELEIVRGDFSLTASFECDPGEILAITGPNGSGKSSILEAVAGILVPESGTIALGKTVLVDEETYLPSEDRQVGYVPQNHDVFGHLSASENVAYGMRMRGVNKKESAKHAIDWLDRLGLAEVANTKGNRLSGGQSQRVAIARALCAEPKVLLLDEPFSSLDASTKPTVIDLVREAVAALNIPTVLVSHDASEVDTLADQRISLTR